jgi:hypothetical protein
MKYLKLLFIITLFLSFEALFAQDYRVIWQHCIGGSGEDKAHYITNGNVGGYLVSGWTASIDGDISYNHGSSDAWLLKTDTTGQILWEKTYGGTNGEFWGKILPASGNCIYLLGASGSSDGDIRYDPYPGSNDLWISKIDSIGTLLWEKIVGGNRGETVNTGFATTDEGFLLFGWTASDSGDVANHIGWYDAWLIKFNSTGDIMWEKCYGTSGMDFGETMIETRDGGYLLGISSQQEYGGNLNCTYGKKAEAVLVKIDSLGNIEWQQCYGGSDNDGVSTLLETEDGYLIGGWADSFDGDVSGNHGGTDMWIIKTDIYGGLIWEKCYGGSRIDAVRSIKATEEGNNLLFGYTQSDDGDVSYNHSTGAYFDIWILKITPVGDLMWEKSIGGFNDEYPIGDIIAKNDYNYLMISPIKYGPSGDVQCTPHGQNGFDEDIWLIEIKDCTHYAPLTPSQPTGPCHACSASGEPARYTVPSLANQTHAWHLEPTEAGTLTTHGDTLTVVWTTTFEGTATFTARGMNDCGESGWSAPFYTEVETCAGIATHHLSGLRLWPNPATAIFNLQLPAGATLPATLALSDLSGRMVLRQTLTETLSTIDCSRVVEGVYFWRVSLGDDQASGKIMIKK